MIPIAISTVGGTSVGYDGTVDEQAWALLASDLGTMYGVWGPADWMVSPVVAGDRTVSIAAGAGHGWGVRDVTPTAVQLQLDPVASGSRVDIIVVRRDWSDSGGVTSFAAITGTAGGDLPLTRAHTPGVLDEQPIAAVQVTAGQTVPVVIADLRVWASNGSAYALSTKVLQYFSRAGTAVRVGGELWEAVVSPDGNASWTSSPVIPKFIMASTPTMVGANAPVGTPLVGQTGYSVITTGSDGIFQYNLPAPFPNAMHSFQATLMAGVGVRLSEAYILAMMGPDGTTFKPQPDRVFGRVFNYAGTPVVGGIFGLSWFAVGW